MPRRAKTPALTYAQLQRRVKDVLKSEGEWVDRYDGMRNRRDTVYQALESARRQLIKKDVEISRLQGYIDRVLDEDRSDQGDAGKGPTRPPERSDSLDRLRNDVANGEQNLDDLSQDEIERLTGRDEDA